MSLSRYIVQRIRVSWILVRDLLSIFVYIRYFIIRDFFSNKHIPYDGITLFYYTMISILAISCIADSTIFVFARCRHFGLIDFPIIGAHTHINVFLKYYISLYFMLTRVPILKALFSCNVLYSGLQGDHFMLWHTHTRMVAHTT